MQATAAVVGGTQSLHTNSRDEALALPNESSALLALRTQQIIAYESGIPDVIDPLAGSYYVEELTDTLEKESFKLIDEIETNLNKKVNTNNLNKYLKDLIERSTAPVNRGRRLKLYYATQTNSDTPSFVLFSNFAKKIPNTYRRFIERSIRDEFSFKGISIKISFKTSRSE